jgi:hypothetical protein
VSMIDDLKEQEGVHDICRLRTCGDRAALIGLQQLRKTRGLAQMGLNIAKSGVVDNMAGATGLEPRDLLRDRQVF